MNMVPWKTKQMSPTYLLMNSTYPWKLLVVMHHGFTKRMKYTTEGFIEFLEKALLTEINMQINGAVQQRHQKSSIDEKYAVH